MKPLKEIIFRPIEDVWQDVTGDSGTLADTLKRLDLIIDDKCQFVRFKDYDKKNCYMVQSRSNESNNNTLGNELRMAAAKLLSRYIVYADGKPVTEILKDWRSALAHARKWSYNLFEQKRKVEILNLWTSEIITLEEAEKRAAKVLKGRQ